MGGGADIPLAVVMTDHQSQQRAAKFPGRGKVVVIVLIFRHEETESQREFIANRLCLVCHTRLHQVLVVISAVESDLPDLMDSCSQ